MISSKDLLEYIMKKSMNYDLVFNHEKTIIKTREVDRDINIFIPVRKRIEFIEPCLSYFERAVKRTSLKVHITVIENDIKPWYMDFLKDKDVDYIFIPVEVSCSDGLFAKSLAYNSGFLKTKRAKWNIFHDLDILVDEDFLEKIQIYLKRNPTWIQPYTNRRVLRVGSAATANIIKDPQNVHRLSEIQGVEPSKPGSPGGSIVVKSNDFISIGGYDPEFFYGYAPEDSFFWAKLELLYNPSQNEIRNHFMGNAFYADSPPIEIYHLNHQMQDTTNPKLGLMLNILESFFNCSKEIRLKIIEKKWEHFSRYVA